MRLEKMLEESMSAQGWEFADWWEGTRARRRATFMRMQPTRGLVI